MKELSIEQKAKDIEIVKQMIADGHISQDVAEKYFPELKESEDELTWLKNYISDEAYSLSMDIRDNEDRIKLKKLQDSLVWLEKQGNPKSNWKPTEEQYEALDYAYNSCSDTERGNYYEGVLETLIEDLHRLDEQHPNFRIGDTIKKKSTGDIVRISVVDLKNKEYRLSNNGFIPFKYEYLWELVERKPMDDANKGESEDIKQKPVEWSEEDEKMWKLIKKYAHYNISDMALDVDHITRAQLESWLEKQGKQKTAWGKEDEMYFENIRIAVKKQYPMGAKYIVNWLKSLKDRIQSKQNNNPQGKTALEAIKEEKVDNANKVEPKFKVGDIVQYITDSTDRRKIEEVDTLCNMYHTDSSPIMFEIEDEWKVVVNAEDVEQNPTDKVEPKFKVGDWVSIGRHDILIGDIRNDLYEGIFTNGEHRVFDIDILDKEAHLWTITDAKDGDIIYATSKFNTFDFIYIFFEIKNEKSWAYCSVERDCNDLDGDSRYWEFDNCKGSIELDRYDFYPATEEQRDILFKKMKEYGYEWDAENKKLRTI